jgi:hypothetical protein
MVITETDLEYLLTEDLDAIGSRTCEIVWKAPGMHWIDAIPYWLSYTTWLPLLHFHKFLCSPFPLSSPWSNVPDLQPISMNTTFLICKPPEAAAKIQLHSSVFQHAATSHEKFMSRASKDRCSPFTLAAYVSVIVLFCWINAYHQSPAQISIMKDLTVIHNCKHVAKPCIHFLWT